MSIVLLGLSVYPPKEPPEALNAWEWATVAQPGKTQVVAAACIMVQGPAQSCVINL
jgi:hypothetical protein